VAVPGRTRIRAVLWDHDGTVVDSIPIVVAASNEVLRARGLPEIPADEVRRGMALPTTPRMGSHARTDDPALRAQLAAEFYVAANRLGPDLARAYPGVGEAVAALARDYPQGLISNNSGTLVRRILATLGLAPHFRLAWGEEDVPAPKPDPRGIALAARELGAAPGECVYVSDGITDVRAARGAGMPIIGVTWGIHPREEMEAAGFDDLVETPEQLLETLRRI
jgi:phosphoglycolate phosphatase